MQVKTDQLYSYFEEKRQVWTVVRKKFMTSLIKQFSHRSSFTNPKSHDPVHDDELVELFGSLKNLDEMNCESIHQISKRIGKNSNKQNLEHKLLSQVCFNNLLLTM